MAGSYRHITTKKGKLRAPGRNLLDNLGDANEAIEELYGMVWYLAEGLADVMEASATDKQTDKERAQTRARIVEDARLHYKDGLEVSPGVQKAGPGKAEPLGALPFGYYPPLGQFRRDGQ